MFVENPGLECLDFFLPKISDNPYIKPVFEKDKIGIAGFLLFKDNIPI